MDPMILPAAIGLIGAALGAFVMWWIASGRITDRFVVRPEAGVPPAPPDAVLAGLAALARDDRPWTVRPCPEEPRADLVAEWRIADARWWGLAQRNGLSAAYRAWFALAPGRREVRCLEQRTSVSWSAGAPAISWSAAGFQGIVLFERTREIVLGLKDDPPLAPGVVVDYDFDPWRVKGPVVKAVLAAGWSFRPVTSFGQLRG